MASSQDVLSLHGSGEKHIPCNHGAFVLSRGLKVPSNWTFLMMSFSGNLFWGDGAREGLSGRDSGCAVVLPSQAQCGRGSCIRGAAVGDAVSPQSPRTGHLVHKDTARQHSEILRLQPALKSPAQKELSWSLCFGAESPSRAKKGIKLRNLFSPSPHSFSPGLCIGECPPL